MSGAKRHLEPTRARGLLRRSASLEWIVVGALFALFVWKGFVVGWTAPNSDFPNYYLGGRLFRAGWPLERLNDWIWMQRQKDHAGLDQALVGYLPSTLWSTLIVVPLTVLPLLPAKRVWLVVNLLLLFAVGLLLRRLTRLEYRRIALLTLLAIVPLRTNFQFGQQHLVVLFLLTVASWAYFHERSVLSGVALALAAALKLYPALFAVFFWRKRRWRALFALIASSLVLVVVGVELFGLESLRVYVFRILPRSLRGEFADPYVTNMSSVTTLLRRLLIFEPELNPRPLTHAPIAYVVLQPILQAGLLFFGLWALDRGDSGVDKQKLDWGAFCLLLLSLSTGTSTYHLCALVLPAILVFDHLVNAGDERRAWLVAALFGLVCFPYGRLIPSSPSGWRIFLGFPRVYPLVALWALVAYGAWRLRARSDGPRTRSETATWLLAFAAWSILGIFSSARHFEGQFANYSSRIDVGSSSLIATTPATMAGDLYFTRMSDTGYVLDRVGQGLTVTVPAGTDLFYPTGNAGSRDGWFELASVTSKVVRFPSHPDRLSVSELVVEANDAEQPAISTDSRWLGFIRQREGRGGLWAIDRRGAPSAGTVAPARERQLLDATNDVLDFAFLPDDRIVLASFRSGRSTLSMIDPATGAQVGVRTSERSARYPAASPNGRWLAYAEEERGQWQLWTMDLETQERHRLTGADCNSVTPAWGSDSKSLVYASDCGRALGQTALCKIAVPPQ